MPLPIYRLRRWLIVIAVLFIAVVAGMYLYARLRELSVLKGFPGKIGLDIRQTAEGFQISKSEGGRTIFTIRAKDVKEFKLNGHAELHDVSIILYGRDTSRFDQIYGDDFTYDPKSGDVTAQGDVQIDLEANPAGDAAPDQATPKELKNPIHLKTRDLIFNRESGNASTAARVDFRTPQASGWAVGVQYAAKSNTLTLTSQIHVTMGGVNAPNLSAAQARITREPRWIVLDHPRLVRPEKGIVQSDEATFFLGPENEVQRVQATGNVNAEANSKDGDSMRARADQAEAILAGRQNLLRTATFTGNVHVERAGSQPMQADAGRAVLDFLGNNQLQKVHAADGVRLAQHATSSHPTPPNSSPPQDFDVTAPVIDFFVAEGKRLDQAQTSGAAQIVISPAHVSDTAGVTGIDPVASGLRRVDQNGRIETLSSTENPPASPQRTVVTAARFDAKFVLSPNGASRLSSIHGAPDAKIVSSTPGNHDRVSTSQTLDAAFFPEGGISSIVQQGSVVYDDGQPSDKRTQAWASKAVYTPVDGLLVLTGSPRVAEGSMVTTATTIRVNRATDDAFAQGDVKTTYSDLKEQPSGALLASSSPIHVTAEAMTAHNSSAVALYQGNARLWQDANVIEAPSIEFHRARRSLLAQGNARQPVTTVLVQSKLGQRGAPQQNSSGTKKWKSDGKTEEKDSASTPITITSARLVYSDPENLAHYEGGVEAKGTGFSATSTTLDVYLVPRSQASGSQSLARPGQLDRMVAQGHVVIVQPDRRAEGQALVYTAGDDKFVLTGGPPSIFDAERGKITGVSLTFYRHDDRVLVEGEEKTPVVTQTRVAKQK
jgi:lipopolysaccharide export system protein LptA